MRKKVLIFLFVFLVNSGFAQDDNSEINNENDIALSLESFSENENLSEEVFEIYLSEDAELSNYLKNIEINWSNKNFGETFRIIKNQFEDSGSNYKKIYDYRIHRILGDEDYLLYIKNTDPTYQMLLNGINNGNILMSLQEIDSRYFKIVRLESLKEMMIELNASESVISQLESQKQGLISDMLDSSRDDPTAVRSFSLEVSNSRTGN